MARFDRSALALDVAAATGAYGDVLALMRKVTGYTSALDGLDLGAVPVHGSSIDPFYNLPGLRQSLQTARTHTPAWGEIAQRLLLQLIQGASLFTPLLTAASGELAQILARAEAAKRPLSADERASIVAKLRTLQGALQQDRATIAQLRTATVDVIRVIARDYAALTIGSQRIDEAIPAVEKATADAAMQYLTPDGVGIYRMIIEAGGKIRARLVELAASVHRLADANADSQKALQGVLAAWETVDVKFKSVIDTLTEAGQSGDDGFELLPLLLDIAAESWQQLLRYFMQEMASRVV